MSDDAWMPLWRAATEAAADGRIFESAVHRQRYRVASVSDDRVVIERLDGSQNETLSRARVVTALQEIVNAGGRVARRSQFYTVAKEAALVALHPRLRWDSSGDWIELDATPTDVRPLLLYEDYSRREVHDIFAPDSAFTPQAGTWGLQGIVEVPERPGDFVVFVTFGQRQGTHLFDEAITEDGVLTWQSQPKESLGDARIRRLIAHDHKRNSIYLFLRTHRDRRYTHLGQLAYLSHDVDREKPVHFRWQVLPHDVPREIAARIGLILEPMTKPEPTPSSGGLIEVRPPGVSPRRGEHTPDFRGRKHADWDERDGKNRALGLAGELLVLEHEKATLRAGGRHDLAERVRHVAVIEGDGAGYDIASFDVAGNHKFVEVKTTRGPITTACFISAHELAYARHKAERYELYRVYAFDDATSSGHFYVIRGDPSKAFVCVPTAFRLGWVAGDVGGDSGAVQVGSG